VDAALPDGLELGQALDRRVAWALVAIHQAGGPGRAVGADLGRLDGGDLAVEAPLGLGPRRVLLGCQGEGVDVLTGDAPTLGDALCRAELVGHVGGIALRARDPRAVEHVHAETHSAHGLDAAGDAHVDGTRRHQPGEEVVRLLGGAALAVHRGGRRLEGQAGAQPGVAGDVRGLLPGLGDAATDDLLHVGRVDPRPLDDLDLSGGEDVGGVHAR
jgi:hypothetical protein